MFDPNAFKIYVKLEFYTFIMLIIKILRVLHQFNHFSHCSRFSFYFFFSALVSAWERALNVLLPASWQMPNAVSLNHIIMHCGFLSCFEMRTLRTAYVTIQSASHTQPTRINHLRTINHTHTHTLSFSLSLKSNRSSHRRSHF